MKHYQKKYEDMILRDYLALDRTKLANERTYLAQIRTFISLLAAGIGLIEFVDVTIATFAGVLLCIISPIFIIVGTYRFYRLRKNIKILEKKNIDSNHNQS